MASVFATQSLLQAVGIGARRSLPAAATINWVLKDGLGRLGRLTVATRWGESFDADLKVSRAGTRARAIADCKTLCADRRRLADPFSLPPPPLFAPPQRFRYTTSLLYCVALGLEYLTPLFPQHFLPLASVGERERTAGVGHALGVHQAAPGCRRHCTPPPLPPPRAPLPPLPANIGKSIGLTTFIATQPAFHRSFACHENLADISAKAQVGPVGAGWRGAGGAGAIDW